MSKKNKMKLDIGGKFKIAVDKKYGIKGLYDTTYYAVIDNIEVYIKEVIFNNPATIVFWSDGTKTVSKCHGNDNYNAETGFMICCMKKLVGSTNFKKALKDWVPESINGFYKHVRTIGDIRAEKKSV